MAEKLEDEARAATLADLHGWADVDGRDARIRELGAAFAESEAARAPLVRHNAELRALLD